MRLGRLACNLVGDLFLAVLAADLLHVYYSSGWTDPVAAVRIAELAVLWGIIPFSLWRAVIHIKEV